jgi:hypothetical protein
MTTDRKQIFADMAANLGKFIALKKRQIELMTTMQKMAERAARGEVAAIEWFDKSKQHKEGEQ